MYEERREDLREEYQKILISIEKNDDTLVVHSAIDNLLKGACGQAVQNMNIMFGIEETVGLKLKPLAF